VAASDLVRVELRDVDAALTIRLHADDSGGLRVRERLSVIRNGPETYGITVTVTKVEGPNIDFDVKVDDQPS